MPGAVSRTQPLRDDALQPHLAGMREHDVAGMREMGVELHPGRDPRSRLASVCLRTSSGSRRKSLQEIKGNEEDLRVVAAMPQLVKARYPAFVAAHGLTVDQATAHLQFVHSLETDAFNTVRPSRYRSPPHNSLAIATPIWEDNRNILFWMCELSHTRNQL